MVYDHYSMIVSPLAKSNFLYSLSCFFVKSVLYCNCLSSSLKSSILISYSVLFSWLFLQIAKPCQIAHGHPIKQIKSDKNYNKNASKAHLLTGLLLSSRNAESRVPDDGKNTFITMIANPVHYSHSIIDSFKSGTSISSSLTLSIWSTKSFLNPIIFLDSDLVFLLTFTGLVVVVEYDSLILLFFYLPKSI